MTAWFLVLTLAVTTTRPTTAPTRELTPRDQLSAASFAGASKVILHGGTYVLTEPLVLGPELSGITIEAAPGETPILSGGRRIEGWRKDKLNVRDCWAADVPDVKAGKWYFRELWIDGRRATRARTPNTSYLKIKDSPDIKTWQDGVTRFVYDADDVPPGPFAYGVEAMAMNRWIENRLPLKDVDAQSKIVRFQKQSHFTLEPGDQYWLEGDARFFDEPGEWHLDRDAGKLYYLPLDAQDMSKVEVIAPVLSQLLILAGDPASKKFIDNLTLRGITFSHTHWSLPEVDPATTKPADTAGFSQAAIQVPAVIRGDGVRACTFENLTVTHTGTWAIELAKACTRNRIDRCTLTDLGAGGIKLGDTAISQSNADQTFANEITNCTISDGGHTFPSAVGIWLGQAFDNRIAHNDIHDFYYTGVSTGWSWGYGDSLNRGNIIEKNHIHHIGKRSLAHGHPGPILSDMGGIYILGGRLGSVVRNNHIHDITAVKYGGWGVYLDEGSSNVRVDSNLIYRTTHGGFHLHYGKDNIVTNNIFSGAREWQIQFSKEEEHQGFTFERNIVHFTSAPALNAFVSKVSFNRNLYGPIAEKYLRFGDKTFQQWQASGQDKNSIVADPTFADPTTGDFTLKIPAIAESIGFVPFDVRDAGPIIPTVVPTTRKVSD